MAKMILVDPYGWQGAVSGHGPFPNVGIAYLIPALREHAHEVLVIDLNNNAMTDTQVLSAIDEYRPDIVGFSAKTATMKGVRTLGQKIKDLFPKAIVMLGGPHTTIAWRELVKEPWLDVVFVGEGEQELPPLCRRLASNEPIEDLPGVITRRNFNDNFSLHRPLIADLNSLPFPEYDLFAENVKESLCLHYPLVTSRGCVYKCTYCSVPEISGRRFRKRSPENVIDELKMAKENYATEEFEIVDDLFNLDIERCKQICRALIEADLGMRWYCPNGLRADRVDKELAQLMSEAGCYKVEVGIESADPDVLKTVKKAETIEDIERGIHIFKEAGIKVGGYFIIGLPGDSFGSQERSVEFAKRMGISAHFNMLVPYPGTELWEWAKANARFLHNVEEGLHFADSSKKVKPVIETEDFPTLQWQRVYEMVHTRLGQFDMVIPKDLSRFQYHCEMLRLLWNYDRVQLPVYIFQRLVGIFRKIFRQFILRSTTKR